MIQPARHVASAAIAATALVAVGPTGFAPAAAQTLAQSVDPADEDAWARLLRYGVQQLNAPGEFEIELGQIDEGERGEVVISRVELRDSAGPWLVAVDVVVDWDAGAALRGALVFNEISAAELSVARAPVGRGDPPSRDDPEAGLELAWPRAPVALEIAELRVDALDLGPALLGERVVGRLRGDLTDVGDRQQAELSIARTDGRTATFDLTTRFDASEESVAIRARAREAAGGLIGASIGAPTGSALQLDVDVSGSPERLGFSLDMTAEDALSAEISGVAAWTEGLNVTAAGAARPGPRADPVLTRALGGAATVDLAFVDDGDGGIALERFALASAALAIEAAGVIDAGADSVALDVDLAPRSPETLAGLLGFDALDGFEGAARVDGRLSAPDATIALRADAVVGAFGRADAASVAVRLASDAEGSRLVASAGLRGAEFRDEDLAALLGAAPELRASGRWLPAERIARLDALRIATPALIAEGAGAVDVGAATADASLTLELRDLAPAFGLAGIDGGGAGSARLEIEGLGGDRLDRLALAANLDQLAFGDPALEQLIGAAADLDLALRGAGDGLVEIVDGRLLAAALHAELSGAVSVPQDSVALRATADIVDPARVRRAFPALDVTAARAEFALDGALSEPDLSFSADISELRAPQADVGRLSLIGDARLQRDERIPLALRLETADVSSPIPAVAAALGDAPIVELVGEIDAAIGRLRIDRAEVSATGVGATVAGEVGADAFGDATLDLRFAAAAPDLSVFGSFDGDATLSGVATGALFAPDVSAALDGSLAGAPFDAEVAVGVRDGALRLDAAEAAYLGARISAGGAVDLGRRSMEIALDLAAPDLTALARPFGSDLAGDLRGQARIAGPLDAPEIAAALQGDGLAASSVAAEEWSLALDGALNALALELTIGRLSAGPIEDAAVSLAAVIDAADPTPAARVDRATLAADAVALRLGAPLTMALDGGAARVDAPSILLADPASGTEGALSGRLAVAAAGLEGVVRIDAAPLSVLGALDLAPIAEGVLNGEATLAPGAGSARLTLADVVAAGADAALQATLSADWRGRALDAAATITPGDAAPLDVTLRAPLRPAALPLIDPNGPLSGEARWSGAVADLLEIAPVDGVVLRGDGALDVAVSGSLAAPLFRGRAALSSGELLHLESGLALTDLAVSATADGDVLRVAGEGSDGRDGVVTITGDMEPFAGAIDLRVAARSARVVQRDDVAVEASADLTLVLSPEESRIAGVVEIEEAEARLVSTGAAEAPLIDVRIAGEDPEGDAAARARPIELDLTIAAPRRLFVRGRGLDSEWSADIRVGGSTAAPRVLGDVVARRGTFSLASTRFDLVRGLVLFQGAPDPVVDVRFEATRNGITGAIAVDGPASAPALSLSSTPAVAEDEILPRLVFGQDPSQLSPVEAAQLAAGLSTLLRGEASALDAVRDLIGVDRLTVGEGDEAAAVVGAGRYVTDRVYVEGRTGVDASEQSVAVEIELAPEIDLEAEIGATGEVGVGLQWRRDY